MVGLEKYVCGHKPCWLGSSWACFSSHAYLVIKAGRRKLTQVALMLLGRSEVTSNDRAWGPPLAHLTAPNVVVLVQIV